MLARKLHYLWYIPLKSPINTSCPSASLSGGLFFVPSDLSTGRNAGKLRANLWEDIL